MSAWAGLLVFAALQPAALRGTITADTGVEYDSNASRIAVEPPQPPPAPQQALQPRAGPLLRALASGSLAYAGPRQRLRLQLSAGGKIYLLPTLQDQDVGVVQLGYEHGAQLERVRLTGAIDYYDAFQAPASPEESRDLRSLQAALRLLAARPVRGLHRIEGGLDVGGQLFQYKPDAGFSFLAPSLTGRFGAHLHAGDPELGHDFDLASHARLEYRGYIGARTDIFLQLGGAATWQGPVLLQLGYTAQLNFSSLAAESYQRHLPLLKLAFRLPGDLYVTAKGQLNLLSGTAGLFVPAGNVDDDNRSLALLDLERPIARGFALSARYTGFFSLPRDAGPSYQRHTAYLGLSYSQRLPR
jgi:hypothetical protein